ncbi:MAG TPA: DUF4388 domain-containing protein [Polyangiaceae bacterium]|jgi:hypothetical protein
MSRSVLLVDPDVDALGDLASKLRSRGLTVLLADGLEGALEQARREEPEAILISDALALSDDFAAGLSQGKGLVAVPRFVLVSELGELRATDLPRGDAEVIARRLYALPSRFAAAAVPPDFRGDLGQVSLADLLQLLSMNRRTGVLSIVAGAGPGEVWLTDGELVDAVYRGLEGEKALYRMLALNEGSFAFVEKAPNPLRRVSVPTSVLLMEGMRRIDEVRRRREQIGEKDALLTVAALTAQGPEVQRRILESLSAPRTLDELVDELPFSDLDILAALQQMLEVGSVRRVERGALRVELGGSEEMTVLGAVAERLSAQGFRGRPRVVLAASHEHFPILSRSLGRIGDTTLPAQTSVAPVPRLLATLRLTDSADLDVFGLPLDDAYAPLWALSVPGSAVVIRLDAAGSGALDELCTLTQVRLVDAAELLGQFDESDPAQVAALIRGALQAAAGA